MQHNACVDTKPYLLKRSQNSRLSGVSKWKHIRSSDVQVNLHSGGVAAAVSRSRWQS